MTTTAPHADAITLKGFLEAPKHTQSMIGKIMPMGDPIDDPKPNKH